MTFDRQVPIGNQLGGAKLDLARNGVEERVALHEEEINGKGHFMVEIQDSCRKGNKGQDRDMRRSTSGCFSFEGSYIGSIDVGSMSSIVGGDRTIVDKVRNKKMFRGSLGWSTKLMVQSSSCICSFDLVPGERSKIVGDSVN